MPDLKTVIFEQALAPFERLLLAGILLDPKVLDSTNLQIANRMGVNEKHVAAAMNRLKKMRFFKRSLETRNLILNDSSEWQILSRN